MLKYYEGLGFRLAPMTSDESIVSAGVVNFGTSDMTVTSSLRITSSLPLMPSGLRRAL
jgi:hypothetical protein